MDARLAVLIAAVALSACLREPSPRAGGECESCHAVHRAEAGACTTCHRGNPQATRAQLAHAGLLTGAAAGHRDGASKAVRRGEALLLAAACRRCHVAGGTGNRLATDLDVAAGRREQQALVASITEPVENMPSFGLDRSQAEALVGYLLHHGRVAVTPDGYRVHFDRATASAANGFEATCGPCHRALTQSGPRGTGTAGPNLSGLFTAHYPRNARDGAWDAAALGDWLRNPRALRSTTTMPPVKVQDDELRRIVGELGAR